MSERLYPVPDKTRASWCFLILETEVTAEVPHIVGWELAIANPHRVIKTIEERSSDPPDEERVLAELCTELKQYQHDNTTLHTIDNLSLLLLRTRLVVAGTNQSHSLRGFHHVPIWDILDLFGPWKSIVLETIDVLDTDETREIDQCPGEWGSLSPRDLWTIRCYLAPLVPIKDFQGDPL